jgi:pyridoxal phosphate enzyme (YggS family)
MTDDIKLNYLAFVDEITRSAAKCGRKAEDIRLVVVTKGQPVEKIVRVLEAGATILGENYPEETVEKIPLLKTSQIEWHMIGHLQSRKVKYIADDFAMIHSIDRAEIAVKLNERLAASEKFMPALFEVNLSGEESKSGFGAWDEHGWDALIDEMMKLCELPFLHFTGLMTMPPFAEDPEDSRNVFINCRRLLERIQKRSGDANFVDLSMGTSLDYTVAIQEGSTFLRIGQAIMGERTYR